MHGKGAWEAGQRLSTPPHPRDREQGRREGCWEQLAACSQPGRVLTSWVDRFLCCEDAPCTVQAPSRSWGRGCQQPALTSRYNTAQQGHRSMHPFRAAHGAERSGTFHWAARGHRDRNPACHKRSPSLALHGGRKAAPHPRHQPLGLRHKAAGVTIWDRRRQFLLTFLAGANRPSHPNQGCSRQ